MGTVYSFAHIYKLLRETKFQHLIDPKFKEPTNEQVQRLEAHLAIAKPDWYSTYYWHAGNSFPFLIAEETTTFSKDMKPQLDVHFRVRWPDKRRANDKYIQWPKYAWDACVRPSIICNRLTTSSNLLDSLITNHIGGWWAVREKKPNLTNPDEAQFLRLHSDHGAASYILSRGLLLRYEYEGTVK